MQSSALSATADALPFGVVVECIWEPSVELATEGDGGASVVAHAVWRSEKNVAIMRAHGAPGAVGRGDWSSREGRDDSYATPIQAVNHTLGIKYYF